MAHDSLFQDALHKLLAGVRIIPRIDVVPDESLLLQCVPEWQYGLVILPIKLQAEMLEAPGSKYTKPVGIYVVFVSLWCYPNRTSANRFGLRMKNASIPKHVKAYTSEI